MRIVIVGGGIVGSNLAREFTAADHDVALIDPDPEVTRKLSEQLDILAVTGSGTSERALREAGIEEAELLVAVSPLDEVNILACLYARAFGVPRRVARIRSLEIADPSAKLTSAELGVDHLVQPEEALVDLIGRLIQVPGATELATLGGGKVVLYGFRVAPHSPIAHKRLSELAECFQDEKFLVAAILSNKVLTIPERTRAIEPGDIVYVVSSENTISFAQSMILGRIETLGRVIIGGASRLGCRLAQRLQEHVENVVLIEPDRTRAEAAAGELKKAVVLHGDTREPALLKEAGVDGASFFIGVTDQDETNMLSGLLARGNGAQHVICLTKNPEYVPVLESIQIDVVLNPWAVTVSEILRYLRHGRIVSGIRLHETDAEVLEVEVPAGSAIASRPLGEVGFPRGAIVAAVLRNGRMVIPDGTTRITPGDEVIVFSRTDAVPRVESLLSGPR